MKTPSKITLPVAIIIASIVLGATYYVVNSEFLTKQALQNEEWLLSLYGDGKTLLRLDYDSKSACLSAGSSYYQGGNSQYSRFDCGFKCSFIDRNNYESAPICEQVCDNYGCR